MKGNLNMKIKYKTKKKPIVLALYFLSIVIGIYTLFTIYSSYTYISMLVSKKGLVISEQLGSVVSYYMNASIPYLFYTISIWGIGYFINNLNILIKNNEPNNYSLKSDNIDIGKGEDDLDSFVEELRNNR